MKLQRSYEHPSVTPSEVPEIIASESEEPSPTVQPVEDHTVSPEATTHIVPGTTEPADVQGNSDRRYPMRHQHPPGYLRIYVSK